MVLFVVAVVVVVVVVVFVVVVVVDVVVVVVVVVVVAVNFDVNDLDLLLDVSIIFISCPDYHLLLGDSWGCSRLQGNPRWGTARPNLILCLQTRK